MPPIGSVQQNAGGVDIKALGFKSSQGIIDLLAAVNIDGKPVISDDRARLNPALKAEQAVRFYTQNFDLKPADLPRLASIIKRDLQLGKLSWDAQSTGQIMAPEGYIPGLIKGALAQGKLMPHEVCQVNEKKAEPAAVAQPELREAETLTFNQPSITAGDHPPAKIELYSKNLAETLGIISYLFKHPIARQAFAEQKGLG